MARGNGKQSRTEIDIKRAFLEILGRKPLNDITVSEVARMAHVSRSTFYLHYSDVSQLFDELVRDIVQSTWQEGAATCPDGFACCSNGTPLCTFARDSRPFRAVVHEDRFILSLVQNRELVETSPLVRTLVESGYSFQAASGLLMFQVSGCFAASVQTRLNDRDWQEMRALIDLFIEGGVEKLKEAAPESTHNATKRP